MDGAIPFPNGMSLDPVFLYDAISKSTDDYIYVIDMRSNVAVISENMYHDFELGGRVVDDLIGNWGKLVHPKDQKAFFDSIDQMMVGLTDTHMIEYQVQNRKGEYVWLLCRGRMQRDEKGEPLTFAGMVTNISSTGRVDYVTGLFTQLECSRCVEQLLKARGRAAGILLLGMDDFTRINDLKGHAFGDLVLRQFAQEIQRVLPPGATMYRYDGDEFVIVLDGAGEDSLRALYEKIRSYAASEHMLDGTAYYCSISGGSARLWKDAESYPNLIQYAASALDCSKQKGKNSYTAFSWEIMAPRLRSQEIANQLQGCILNHMEGFSLAFQPIVEAATLRLCGAEALLRWSSESLGNISAEEFIPLLESNSMIISVGRWVLQQALSTTREWVRRMPEFTLNVNISFLQMLDQSFVFFIQQTVKENGFDPSNLVLEITESCFVTDRSVLDSSFRELRRMGIRVAMDDFGTGYSSIGMLCDSPADIVKIDRVFTNRIGDQDHMLNSDFLRAVIQLCHSAAIHVCVEGVEKEQELKAVQGIGADTIQGFYISVPICAEKFEEHFLNR